MNYRRLGRSGLQISELSFGSWVTFHNQLDKNEAESLMAMAYEQGVNFFDNAEVYASGESEKLMGESLKNLGFSRDTYCVSSKVFWGGEKPTQKGLSRKHIVEACHAALKRLQVDYLDLYYCHRPDHQAPIEETVRAMSHLVDQGKVLYWGTSEWNAQQLTEAYELCYQLGLNPPTMEQPEYNLFQRDKVERDFAPLYQKYGLGTTIWSPLASGLLTGKYQEGIPQGSRATLPGYDWLREKFESSDGAQKIQKASELKKIADRLGFSTAQLAIAWCLKNPHVSTVILGATKPQQLKENLESMNIVSKLTDEVCQEIEAIVQTRPHPFPTF